MTTPTGDAVIGSTDGANWRVIFPDGVGGTFPALSCPGGILTIGDVGWPKINVNFAGGLRAQFNDNGMFKAYGTAGTISVAAVHEFNSLHTANVVCQFNHTAADALGIMVQYHS